MKKLLLSLLSLLFVFQIALAQNGSKELKAAEKALSAYNIDPLNSKAKLQEAVDAIQVAETGSETAKDPKTYLAKGQIYDEIARQVVVVNETNIGSIDDLPAVDNPAVEAANAYLQSLKYAEKSRDTKEALKGLVTVQTNLSNLGIYAIRGSDYAGAYANFNTGLAVHDALKANSEASILDADGQLSDQRYYTGLAALLNQDYDAAKPLYMQLADENYEQAGIYEGLYQIASSEGDADAAYAYLEKGREKYPDDVTLLFAEINHYLKQGKLDVLTDKLQAAIEKEPENVSLYTTTGNVYDQLFQKAYSAGEIEKANQYFEKALSYFEQSLEIDPANSDAIYSIGALYFNRGAQMSQALAELSNDFSKEGQKKYAELEAKVNAEFEKALPWFQKAEINNPNDINTIIALKEMYARRGEFDKSNEFKDRLEAVQAGGTVEAYHQN